MLASAIQAWVPLARTKPLTGVHNGMQWLHTTDRLGYNDINISIATWNEHTTIYNCTRKVGDINKWIVQRNKPEGTLWCFVMSLVYLYHQAEDKIIMTEIVTRQMAAITDCTLYIYFHLCFRASWYCEIQIQGCNICIYITCTAAEFHEVQVYEQVV